MRYKMTVKKARELEEKLRKEDFTLDDFYQQLQQLKRMGPLESILEMVPGMGKALKGLKIDQKAMVRVESIINSMTKDERRKPHLVDGSRRRRIAQGSGTSVQDVNQLLKQFFMMQKMIKKAAKMDLKKLEKGFLPLR